MKSVRTCAFLFNCISGIGEVCTLLSYRRLGISKSLLNDAIRIMTEEENMQLSFLHASEAIQPLYAKAGYVAVPSRWSVIKVSPTDFGPLSLSWENRFEFRQAKFPQDTLNCVAIHKDFSERRFSGCVIRSEDYWNSYISAELKDSFFVLAEKNTSHVCAWISIRYKSGKYQLRDFGNNTNVLPTGKAFAVLLRKTLSAMKIQLDHEMNYLPLHLPTAVLDEIKSSVGNLSNGFNFEDAFADDDLGWMWKSLRSEGEKGFVCMDEIARKLSHCIWLSDNF